MEKERVEKEKVRVNENDRNRNNVKETTTTTTETTAGTVEEYTPGESIVVRTEAAEPVHYRLSKQVVYVNGAGQVVEAIAIRKTARFQYHYVHEGNETAVGRVMTD